MFKCSVCGFISNEADAPDVCPRCGAPKEKFVTLSEEAAEKIDRACFSNSLHMELAGLMDQVAALCEEGIEDELDPGCVAVFTKGLDAAEIVKACVMAEIEVHVNKSKWG